jgi:hypothetical protein
LVRDQPVTPNERKDMIKRTRPYRTQRIVHQGKTKLITTADNKSIWDLLKKYVNNFPMNEILSRSKMISTIYREFHKYIPYNTVDTYLYNLKIVNVLEALGSGKYKKLRDIPIHLTTSQLRKISNKNSWESWFMTIDYV